MIEKLGLGIDLVDIQLFKSRPYVSNKTFYKKIFTTSEINYCKKFANSYEHFAGKFAIKECVKKSISENVDILDIVTDHFDSKPVVIIKNNKYYSFRVSLSHEGNFAIAIVISEKN